MRHHRLPSPGAFAALALAACAYPADAPDIAEAPTGDLEALPAVRTVEVGAQVIASSETLRYRAFATRHRADGPEPVEVPPLQARFSGRGDHVQLDVDVAGQVASVPLAPDGRVLADFAGEPAGGDVYDILPPAATVLTIGQPYASAGPTDAYVEANAARGAMTIDELVTSTPVHAWSAGGATIVRVELRAMNRLYWLGPDGGIGSQDLGLSYLGVADLLAVPGQGWRVARLVRLSEGDTGKDAASVTLADLRRVPHTEFVACAERSSLVDGSLRKLARLSSNAVPELQRCLGL